MHNCVGPGGVCTLDLQLQPEPAVSVTAPVMETTDAQNSSLPNPWCILVGLLLCVAHSIVCVLVSTAVCKGPPPHPTNATFASCSASNLPGTVCNGTCPYPLWDDPSTTGPAATCGPDGEWQLRGDCKGEFLNG